MRQAGCGLSGGRRGLWTSMCIVSVRRSAEACRPRRAGGETRGSVRREVADACLSVPKLPSATRASTWIGALGRQMSCITFNPT